MASNPYIATHALDYDMNHDGVVDASDDTIVDGAQGTVLGDDGYKFKYDRNLDAVISGSDDIDDIVAENYDLATIRAAILTGATQQLDIGDFDPYLQAVVVADNYAELKKFASGWLRYQKGTQYGAILPPQHPTAYDCDCQTADIAYASYKLLGSGVFLPALGIGHMYRVVWDGGDWTDLSNWHIEDGGSNWWVANDGGLPAIRQTIHIYIPFEIRPSGKLGCYILDVNYGEETVGYHDPVTEQSGVGEADAMWEFGGHKLPWVGDADVPLFGDLGINNHLVLSASHISSLTGTTVTLHGLIGDITENCDERGFDWDTDPFTSFDDSWTEEGDFGIGTFSHAITGLSTATIYHFRAKAHDTNGWVYSPTFMLTTKGNVRKINGTYCGPASYIGLGWLSGINGTQLTFTKSPSPGGYIKKVNGTTIRPGGYSRI